MRPVPFVSSEVEIPQGILHLHRVSASLDTNGDCLWRVCEKKMVHPEGFEPPGPLIRSQVLYPAELRVLGRALLGKAGAFRNIYFRRSAACAAASRAIGTRYGEALT